MQAKRVDPQDTSTEIFCVLRIERPFFMLAAPFRPSWISICGRHTESKSDTPYLESNTG